VRGWIGETVADLGGAFPGRESWSRARALIEKSKFSSLISHVIAPHATDTVSSELLKECADYARENKIPLHMHLSQTPGERDRVKARENLSPVAIAAKAGALTPMSLVVHLTSADQQDLQIIKDSGATIGYCPTSTLFYDKLASIEDFYRLDIPLAIGTDCAASNDNADILEEIKIASLVGRDHRISHAQLTPDHLLAMATTIPAKVLGRSHDLGTLEPGKLADLVLLKLSLSSEPRDNPLANVFYSMGARDVTHVMVNGRWALWNRDLPDWDENQLKADYLEAVQEIRSRIKTQTNGKT
jgi:5-methylthioadenosine/S-adenosylhomocysteine deaminase